jgi:hypothetical protein
MSEKEREQKIQEIKDEIERFSLENLGKMAPWDIVRYTKYIVHKMAKERGINI